MIKTIIFKHMQLALFAYPIYWRKARKYQRNLHLAIRLILGNYWQKKLISQHGKHFIELQLGYFIDIFEDNGKILCHHFVTDSINVKENRPLATKKHKKILIYINLAQPYQKTIDIFTGSNNTQNFAKGYWFVRNYWEAQWLGKVKAVAGGVLKKRCSGDMRQIYRKKPMTNFDFNKVAKQLYWNRASAWVFSCKCAAYFQNTFSYEHLWVAVSGKVTDQCY